MLYPYTDTSQMTPFLPEDRKLSDLLALAGELAVGARDLLASTPLVLRGRLREVLRPMNSYYTNKIEGQHTEPLLIARALKKDFSDQPDLARRQRVAIAHIETEKWVEAAWPVYDAMRYFDADVFRAVHRHLYAQLPVEDREVGFDTETKGEVAVLMPGDFRDRGVKVGAHIPPDPATIPEFLRVLKGAYQFARGGDQAVVALMASHHRLAWIHPFLDGNGRTARLHLHGGLNALGLTQGMWSVMRGIARNHEAYYRVLAMADHHRKGDYDGRGALTQAGLIEVIRFLLEISLDQVHFMKSVLATENLETRFKMLLSAEAHDTKTPHLKSEATLPLMVLTGRDSLSRAEFKAMTLLADRTSDRVLSDLLKYGLLSSDTPRGPVKLALPLASFRYLFPRLWPEAEVDMPDSASQA